MPNGEPEMAATLLPTDDGLAHQPARDEPMMAALPRIHPRAGAKRFRQEWLHHSPLILFEEGFAPNRRIREACTRRGVVPRETVRSAPLDFTLALVAAGGVTLLPQPVAHDRHLTGPETQPWPATTCAGKRCWRAPWQRPVTRRPCLAGPGCGQGP